MSSISHSDDPASLKYGVDRLVDSCPAVFWPKPGGGCGGGSEVPGREWTRPFTAALTGRLALS